MTKTKLTVAEYILNVLNFQERAKIISLTIIVLLRKNCLILLMF